MEKKFPTVVTIGGRRYVKNNINKSSVDGRMKLREAIKSLGRKVQKSKISHCTIESKTSLHAYKLDDSKVLFNKNNKPIGFIVTGKSETIEKAIGKEISRKIDGEDVPKESENIEREEKP
ncbi:uncharacterized protein Eint_041580 [Encephalitozoon intestinalis ATCC 50506]|uniref:Uncharacterized protein n=1 Tax=Encephalitozoon intestinalis (strain ATCC 50506) TaxID=876142 RepID=E0S6W0_ENCIT|nr:uncharacterized protein Eint_041580 [Encephalitozoon intestinalis ATCC 50506]ADM11445.1 hypothetical protein Eint_041580 [Encephalitozoon intestinalis ATCC 50506]UTX45141.1 ap-2 complex subunit sigma-1 [Encephalitozoon intestinalis]